MSFILSIESSTPLCSVAIHHEGKLIGSQKYHLPNAHSSLLPGIIDQLLINSGILKEKLMAVSISGGPGSYTGLRIGASTAKGLCLGLGIPLISVSSLDSLFQSVKDQFRNHVICSMIDARRMEVYCDLKKSSGEVIWEKHPLIVDEHSFEEFADQKVVLVGTGTTKFREVLDFPYIQILDDHLPQADFMGILAFQKFQNSEFEDLIYFEPDYLKEFRTKIPV